MWSQEGSELSKLFKEVFQAGLSAVCHSYIKPFQPTTKRTTQEAKHLVCFQSMLKTGHFPQIHIRKQQYQQKYKREIFLGVVLWYVVD